MLYRILAIVALIGLMVLGANGHLQRWFGMDTSGGTHASVFGGYGGADLRAVEGWARATVAAEKCGFKLTGAVNALEESSWETSGPAQRMIAEVRKAGEGPDQTTFCAETLADYGPTGAKIGGLVEPADG